MDLVKEAFQKIKEEIILLKQEIALIKTQLDKQNPTNLHKNPTYLAHPTDTPAHFNPPISHGTYLSNGKNQFSTGNDGVPTDNPTYTPTNPQTIDLLSKLPSPPIRQLTRDAPFIEEKKHSTEQLDFVRVQEALDSLDAIKKEIRLKFKRLTPQEMMVFSTLYTLESQGFEEITYKLIANHLNLSESSIRDYLNKLLAKGIPISKIKLNNKTVCLSISSELKKIASLSTINKLREL